MILVLNWVLILLFLFGGIFLILIYRNHKLIFDNENIITYDFFGNECKTKWNEIVSLKTNSISGFVSIIDSNKNKIRLHQFLINNTLFIKYIFNVYNTIYPLFLLLYLFATY